MQRPKPPIPDQRNALSSPCGPLYTCLMTEEMHVRICARAGPKCSSLSRSSAIEIGEQTGQEADGRQPGAELIDKDDAGRIGNAAQHGRADAAHSKSEAEEYSGDQAYAAGHQFLRIDDDGRKC